MENKGIKILGTRGIPACHGGFETFAEQLSLYLVDHGWNVTVYCQEQGQGEIREDSWNGIRRITIPVRHDGAIGTIIFDWKATLHASRDNQLILLLGYNTAVFSVLTRVRGVKSLINMDGLEWKREKWNFLERSWLYLNERVACLIGNHLIADHPEIRKHLARRVSQKKISMIPYGADIVREADASILDAYGLSPAGYLLIVARLEPENSILEMVRAFSAKTRNKKLVVVGDYAPDDEPYHAKIRETAGNEVLFPGAIYQRELVSALRNHALLYLHGHQVGGTNPSLVESMGAASAIVAHDNPFNRWVAGEEAEYFSGDEQLSAILDSLLEDNETIPAMKVASRNRFSEQFTWPEVLAKYEELLEQWQ